MPDETYIVSGASLSATADAIRAKGGTSAEIEYDSNGFAAAVTALPSGGGGGGTYQAKTGITPTESSQTITADSGYDALSSVQIDAVSSSYVGSGITRRSSTDLSASGDTVSVPAGYYENSVSKSVLSGTAGNPSITRGTVSNHSITLTPTVTNTGGYITGGTKTGISEIVLASDLVSGSETKTANGTYDVTNLASLVVNVSGGVSNFVTGTFTTGGSAGNGSVSISYSGTGYPVMAVVVIEGGAYNSNISGWYNSTQRYAVGQWTMTKSEFTSTPTYGTSGSANYGVTTYIYKNSTSNSGSYSRSSAMNTIVYSSSNANNAGATCVRFTANKTLSYYVNTSSYGLLPSTTYRYYIVYSS